MQGEGKSMMEMSERYKAALYAGIIGDALGVPMETGTRNELTLCAVKNMLGYGRYDHPKGTWSDDTSMILCTMESLLNGYNLDNLAQSYCSWLFDGAWTINGYAFDAGLTTVTALENIRSKTKSPLESGGTSVDDNGNGSLMRTLPAALYFASVDLDTFLSRIHEISSITHAHPRTKIGCGIYALIIRNLLKFDDKLEAYHASMEEALGYYKNKPHFKNDIQSYFRILSKELLTLPDSQIYSSGYVVDTLETTLWCFLNYASTREILTGTVTMGLDTDTNGTAAGGIAGLYYGLSSVPQDWIDSLAKKDKIDSAITAFVNLLTERSKTGSL